MECVCLPDLEKKYPYNKNSRIISALGGRYQRDTQYVKNFCSVVGGGVLLGIGKFDLLAEHYRCVISLVDRTSGKNIVLIPPPISRRWGRIFTCWLPPTPGPASNLVSIYTITISRATICTEDIESCDLIFIRFFFLHYYWRHKVL